MTGQNEADRQEVPGHVISLSESVPPAQSKVQNFAASDIITGNKPTWKQTHQPLSEHSFRDYLQRCHRQRVPRGHSQVANSSEVTGHHARPAGGAAGPERCE